MEDVTNKEAEKIWVRICPDCGGKLLLGPFGGMSRNVRCDNCNRLFQVPAIKQLLPKRIIEK